MIKKKEGTLYDRKDDMTVIRQVQDCRVSYCHVLRCALTHCNVSCSIWLRVLPQCITRTCEGAQNKGLLKLYPPIELGLHT